MKLINQLFDKQKKVTIEFCQNNLDQFFTEESFSDYNPFLNQKKITYKEYECQSRCKECKQSPYAVINGQFISADSPEELLKELKRLAENNK